MEYFDLNIRPVLIDDITTCIANLITNAIIECHNQTYIQNSLFNYDKNTRTLKINDDGTGIKLLDFVAHLNVTDNGITCELRDAISIFMANKINIKIESNFGTFTPVLRNKEVNGQQIPCIFIAYDQTNSIKDHHGTQITLNPIKKQIIDELKLDFSFLQNWTKVISTTRGSILIGRTSTNIYLNGKNITHFGTNNFHFHHHFIFSYDISENPKEAILFKNNSAEYITTYINQILQQLNNEDKETIYAKYINKYDSFEWNDSAIRNTIIKYLTKLTPTKYIIAMSVEKMVL